MKTCREESIAGFTIKIEQHEDVRALIEQGRKEARGN